MTVFGWEIAIADMARSWPQSGPVHAFFKFWTDYSQSRWLLLSFVIFMAIKIGWRKLVIPSSMAILAAVMGDLVSRRIIKVIFMRPRPNFLGTECSLSYCWGFVSSHSTNITAAATALVLYDKRNAIWVIPVATLVCFSRIYLFDHFALDVIGGMATGAILGYVSFQIISILVQQIEKLRWKMRA